MYASKETRINLAKYLHLPIYDEFSQDWEYEVADPTKISDFLNVYSCECLDDNEKCVLYNIILASYNEAIGNNSARTEDWRLIREYFIKDKHIHIKTVEYWSVPGEIDPNNCFFITPFLRNLTSEGSELAQG